MSAHDSRMLIRWPTYLLIAVFALALGAAAARAPIVAGAPSINGLSAAEAASTMFDRSEYALARSWRAARDGDGEEARRWARESLSHAPGNAYAALALAWGETIAGDEEAGREALAQSYRLAPRSTPLAASRVALAQRWWPQMTDEERARLVREVRIARGVDAHRFNLIAVDVPRLKVLHDYGRTNR